MYKSNFSKHPYKHTLYAFVYKILKYAVFLLGESFMYKNKNTEEFYFLTNVKSK